MKTKQETFDMVVRGLACQGWQQSLGVDGEGVRQCLYRGPNGLKCAVGHLIPDELYQESFEGQHMAMDATETNVVGLMAREGHDVRFLDDCQCTHDSHLSETPKAMRQRFVDLAERHDLTWPEAADGLGNRSEAGVRGGGRPVNETDMARDAQARYDDDPFSNLHPMHERELTKVGTRGDR